jgi:hypothetical protein
MTLVGESSGPASAEARYAAYPTPAGVHLIDTATGVERELTAPAGCRFADVGGRQALWNCPMPGRQEGRVLDLVTDDVRSVPVPESGFGGRYDSVGRHWVSAVTSGNHYSDARSYVNLQTGMYPELSSPLDSDPRVVADLDSPQLVRRLCRPLRRILNASHGGDSTQTIGEPFLPFAFERPYGVRVGKTLAGPRLAVGRCGTRKRRLFRGTEDVQLHSGLLTWRDGSTVRAFVPRTGRSYRWPLRTIDATAASATVTHTAHRVFVTADGDATRVYSAPWQP